MGYGKRLRRRRAQLHFTQKQLAARANLSPATISRIELENRYPTPLTQQALAEVLRVDPDDLFSRNGDES